MRLSGASSASPRAERLPANLRGYILDGESLQATADTAGGPTPSLTATVRDNDTLTAQPLLLRQIQDDDRVRAAPGIVAVIRDDEMIRATADLTDFAYERDFVLRAFSELPAETLTDFVVLGYELSGSWLAAHIEHASAFDVLLLDAAGVPLDHNIVFYDGTNGVLRLDFRIPSLALGADFRWRMRYGRLGVTSTYANPAGCFRRALAAWEWSAGLDLTGRNRDLDSISGVTQSTLKGPCGVFGTASAAAASGAVWANGLNAASIEMWISPSAVPAVDASMFRLGASAAGSSKFQLHFDSTTGAWQVNTNFGGNAQAIAIDGSFAAADQHLVMTGGNGLPPVIYKNALAITEASAGPAGSIAATTDDYVSFGLNSQTHAAGVPGKYGRAILWPFALTPGWVAASYAIQARPQACIGMGPELTAGTANRAPVAVPMLGTQEAGATVDYDVAQRSYDAEGDTRTASVPSQAAGVQASIVAGKVRLRPDGGTGGQVIEQPVRVTDGQSRSSDTVVRVAVTAPVVVPPAGLPVGYPTPPSFAGAETVNVSTRAELQAAINSAPLTGAGRIIVLAPGVNYSPGVPYAPITINRSTARIKLVCNTPRFSSLITDRATLDSINLTVSSNTSQVVVNNCIPGGLRAHSATARVGLSVTRCGILWVEGLDFHDPHKLMVNRQSGGGTTNGIDQLWVRRCSFSESDTNLIGLGGTSNRGVDIFVAWENYLFGDGVTVDTGPSGTATGGVITDYPMQFYKCGDLFVYKCIFQGGANHSISTKLDCGPLRVDDCVFANYHPADYSWKNFELGQEGSPTGNDLTCRLTTVKGCTFTAATGTTKYNVAMLKDVTGLIFDGNIVYDGPGGFLDVRPAPSRSGPNDQGVLAGSQGILIQNNLFGRPGALAQPGACNLDVMYTDSGGGYVFTARNNQYSAVRAVSIPARARTRVSTSYGPNPGFSG